MHYVDGGAEDDLSISTAGAEGMTATGGGDGGGAGPPSVASSYRGVSVRSLVPSNGSTNGSPSRFPGNAGSRSNRRGGGGGMDSPGSSVKGPVLAKEEAFKEVFGMENEWGTYFTLLDLHFLYVCRCVCARSCIFKIFSSF
jgi:hypothetical protein